MQGWFGTVKGEGRVAPRVFRAPHNHFQPQPPTYCLSLHGEDRFGAIVFQPTMDFNPRQVNPQPQLAPVSLIMLFDVHY